MGRKSSRWRRRMSVFPRHGAILSGEARNQRLKQADRASKLENQRPKQVDQTANLGDPDWILRLRRVFLRLRRAILRLQRLNLGFRDPIWDFRGRISDFVRRISSDRLWEAVA